MKVPTDIQTYLEQGKQHLAMGQAREAAIAYAHGAQLEPHNPQVHLGLAEANLALGNYNVVHMASQRVQELQPSAGNENLLARALLYLLERRYDYALQDVDTLISYDPSIAYVHALRSYLLRALGQDYDANLARARAARLSFGGRFENCFPPLSERYAAGYNGTSTQPGGQSVTDQPHSKTWSNRSKLQRQIIRTRFALSRYPQIVTYILIAINVIVYLMLALASKSLNIGIDTILLAGAENRAFIELTGEYWRIFTAMFLHFDLMHIGLNMLSLFFIGPMVEMVYGKWRYLVIYLGSGIIGGIVSYFFSDPLAVAAGASGAIFGIFGALGVFYLMNRAARGAIGNWLFWLGINIAWGFFLPGIGLADHIGGLIAGMLLSFLLIPHTRSRRYS